MQKALTILACLFSSFASSQSTRLSLYEYFSGESCASCASVTPYVNTLLAQASFTNKVVGITWPGPLPGAPSATWSLYNNFKAGIDWRFGAAASGGYGYSTQWTASTTPVSGINTAPMGLIDGRHQWQFGATNDAPGSLNNSIINAAQSATTAFALSLTGNWNSTFSAVELTVSVTAGSVYTTSSPLIVRLVMLEKEIIFAQPPGTSGETVFKNVAISAFPDLQNGTPIAPSWTVGQTQTFTINCPLPSYIHNKSQIMFVGFIQNDGTRQVEQAARCTPPPIANDMAARWLLSPPISCGNTFTPSAIVANLGSTPVYSFLIEPYLNGTGLTPVAWNGTLNPGTSQTVTLASYTTQITGGNTFSYNLNNVSGSDFNSLNNATTAVVFLASAYTSTEVTETFGGSYFPPAGWGMTNSNFGPGWSPAYHPNGPSINTGTGAACFNFFTNSSVGDADELILPPLNLTGGKAPVLKFDLAYAMYNLDNDRLDIVASNNCGKTWSTLYSKSGPGLATAPPQTTLFIPSSSQWRSETVQLTGFNTDSVLVKFVATSAFGNNLYLDNVVLQQTDLLALNQVSEGSESIYVYPNPTSNKLTANLGFAANEPVAFEFCDAPGQLVKAGYCQMKSAEGIVELDTSELPDGVYLLKLYQQTNKRFAKVIIKH